MAKPTLLQTLLGRPSQSYTPPPQKHYFSQKAQLLRRVSAEPEASGDGKAIPSNEPTTLDVSHDTRLSLSPPAIVETNDSDSDDSDSDVFYTPNSSPRISMASNTGPAAVSIPSTKTWASRSSISVESVSLDGHSIFSSDSSPSTGFTTPITSESGHSEPLFKRRPSQDTWVQDKQRLGVAARHNTLRSTKPPKSPLASSSSAHVPSTRSPSIKTAVTRTPSARSTSTRSNSVSRSVSPVSRSRKQAPSIMMSMTALLEEDESIRGPSRLMEHPLSNVFIPPASRPRVGSSPPSLRFSAGHVRHHSSPVSEPYNPSIPSSGTPGYTSLTLPRAPPPTFASNTNKRMSLLSRDDLIDLTKSGIAQTTMASVEVVRGIVAGSSRSLFHRKVAPKGDVLGFTSYRVPPSTVPSHGVLVQVWAVAVDMTDYRLASSESTGFVPGRSFVGRVLECGWEVKDEVARKGDWVAGLLDVRKSGALQQFIVADRHRIYRVLHPLFDGNMSPEELTLLSLCGLPAYRAARTFTVAFGSSDKPSCENPHKPDCRRVLVLQGHDGVGAIAVQILARRGWRVCVHAPMLDVQDETAYMHNIEDRVRMWGGEEVVFDDGGGNGAVVRVLERLVADGDTFDGILDTVGGKDIWEVSQKLFRRSSKDRQSKLESRGQFTTLVGDAPEKIVPGAGSHFKAGLRALRNTHNHDGGNVGYAWVSSAQDVDWGGEDVRESMGAVLRLAVSTGIKPFMGDEGKIVPFERAPSVFSSASFEGGSTIVVKVVS